MDVRGAQSDRGSRRAGDLVAPTRRNARKPEDHLGGAAGRRPLRPVRERARLRLVPRHPGAPRGRVRAGGVERDVTFVDVGDDVEEQIDDAYRTKYRRYAENIVGSTLTSDARSATLKLVPRD
jgi:Uncharacterized protein conserved in bacteria (DUF2255)